MGFHDTDEEEAGSARGCRVQVGCGVSGTMLPSTAAPALQAEWQERGQTKTADQAI